MTFRALGAQALSAAIFLSAASAGAGGCSSGASGEAVAATTAAIENGTDDRTHSFAVGVCGGAPGACQLTCSGALLAPNLVVTARHCVENTSDTVDCATSNFTGRLGRDNQFWITTDFSMHQTASGWHQAAKIVTPDPTGVCGNDLALIVLADVVPASEATPVTPGVRYPLTNHAAYAFAETAIGYGLTAPPAANPPANAPDTAGYRRFKSNIPIVCIPNDPDASLDCYRLDARTKGVVAENELEAGDGTCQGDSGSSAFDERSFDDGHPITLGVLSRGGVDDTGAHCAGAIYTRLDRWRDFIVATATTAAAQGGYPVPAWTAPLSPGAETAGAGAKSDASSPLGASCSLDRECDSGLCTAPAAAAGAPAAPAACSRLCDAAAACPGGFACLSGSCFADGATPAAGGSGGCAIGAPTRAVGADRSSTGVMVGASALAMLASIARARRRSRTAR